MTIKELLGIKEYKEDNWWGQEVLGKIFENYLGEISSASMRKRLIVRDYMNDSCNDCRSRTLEIVFLDREPILFYQYVGRGDYRNIRVLNKEKLIEVYLDLLDFDEVVVADINKGINIETYGAELIMELGGGIHTVSKPLGRDGNNK